MEIQDLQARYTNEGLLGKGGMGEVLLATDQRLKRKVAIKRMLGNAAGSQTAVSRFLTEAQSMADINHPNIVSIHDHGRAKDGPFLIMEYVEGGSLLDLCRAGALPADQAIHLVCKLCDGLVKAHAANIIHRDIKPANVLLTEDGEPKLTDFGLAKDGAADTGMTMTGTVLGTLDFMPPEQRRDATQTDARSDLWSLAATLYQMITGRSPKVIRLDLVHESLRPVLAQALEEDPGDRFQTAAEMRDALSASLAGQTADSGDVELEAGACPHCGTKNPTNRKFCRNPDCGCSLEVPCLSCDSKIPMWEQVCNDCGSPQRDLLEQRRQQMASGRSAAESCLEKCDFERAQKLAIALRDEPDLRLQHLKGWAARFLPEIGARRERELKRIGALMSEALTHQQAHDYATGLRTLEQVPALLANVAVPPQQQTANDLKTALEQSLAEINRLDDLIHSRVTKRELDGLLAEVEALQTLQPDREDLEQLHAQLAKREAKLRGTRDEAFSAARKRFNAQDYVNCLKQLARIDPTLIDAQIRQLQERAETDQSRLKELRETIQARIKTNQLHDLLSSVEEALELQQNAEDLQKLRQQLRDREEKLRATRDEALPAARKQFDAQNYDHCLKQLARIDSTLIDDQIRWLQNRAADYQSRLTVLRETIQARVKANELHDLLSSVEEALGLQQDAEDLQKLRQQLREREEKNAAALVSVLDNASKLREQCQFQAAVSALQRIPDELSTQKSSSLLQDCQSLQNQQSQALNGLRSAMQSGTFKLGLAGARGYRDALERSGLVDAAFQKAYDDCGSAMRAKVEAEEAALRQKALLIKLRRGLTAAVILLVVTGVGLAIFSKIRSWLQASAVATAIENQDWDEVLAMDSDHAEALVGRARSRLVFRREDLVRGIKGKTPDIEGALADLNHAEQIDPKMKPFTDPVRRQIARMKAESTRKKRLADLGKTFEERVAVARADAEQIVSQTPRENSIGMQFKRIPSLVFVMGHRLHPDAHAHQVVLTRPFELGVFEVTQEQYEKVMGTNPSKFKGPKKPVEQVLWEDAVKFCRKLSELPAEKSAGNVYRLPTEAEWECVCRASRPSLSETWKNFKEITRSSPSKNIRSKADRRPVRPGGLDVQLKLMLSRNSQRYSFGDDGSQLGDYAWYKDNSGNETHPIGQKKPNPWGFFDMYGNVSEWCQDWYGSYGTDKLKHGWATDPMGPTSGSARVYRGGNWAHSGFPSWSRSKRRPSGPDRTIGFRVARSLSTTIR